MKTAVFKIWRGDANGGDFVDYTTEISEGMVVLDAVHQIQANQANDLACRWNCKAGKCGSCSAEINGMPKLMCMTRLDQLPLDQPVTVEPMRAFPRIRDLTTDVSWNYRVKKKIKKFKPRPPAALEMPPLDTENRLSELKQAAGIGYCNITKCCTKVCPENITITDNAIIPLKERVVDRFYDPIKRLLRVIQK